MPRRVYAPELPPPKRKSAATRAAPAWMEHRQPPAPSADEQPSRLARTVEDLPSLETKRQVEVPEPIAEVTKAKVEMAPAPPPAEPKPEVPRWIQQVWKLDLADVAEVLGLVIEGDRLRPCPLCQSDDSAEVFTTKKGFTLWRCRPCHVHGSGVLDLASYTLAGEKAGDLAPEERELLRRWFADCGWCDGEGGAAE